MNTEVIQMCSIDEDGFDSFSCINCGAYAEKPEDIKHHKGCCPGEAKKWEEFYEKEK